MVMVVVMEGLFPINQALDVPKLLDMARDGNGSFLIKTVLFLSFLQQLHEQRVIEVYHRHHKPLRFLSLLSHLYRQAPFWHISHHHLLLLLFMMMMMMINV